MIILTALKLHSVVIYILGEDLSCRTGADCPSTMVDSLVKKMTGMPYSPMSDGMCEAGYKAECDEGQCGLAEVQPVYSCLSEE